MLRSILFLPLLVPLVAAASMFFSSSCPASDCSIITSPSSACRAPNWIGDPDIALYSIMGLTIWKNAGYYMLFFLAGLQTIPPESMRPRRSTARRLAAAALCDAAVSAPTSAFVFVIALINVLTQVDHIFVLTKGGPSDSTKLLLFYVYRAGGGALRLRQGRGGDRALAPILLAISGVAAAMDRGRAMPRPTASVPTANRRRARLCGRAFLWVMPFLWMMVAAFRPENAGGRHGIAVAGLRSELANFRDASMAARSALYYLNTLDHRGGHPGGAVVTMSLAAYAFARLRFPGKTCSSTLFLIQLMLVPTCSDRAEPHDGRAISGSTTRCSA